MKVLSGLTVLLGFMVFGVAVLAGGYLWVLDGNLWTGCAGGAGVGIAVAWLFRALGQKRRSFRFIGEVQEGIDEEDFTEPVDEREVALNRVQKRVEQQPDRVAGSIRLLLVDDPRKRKKG